MGAERGTGSSDGAHLGMRSWVHICGHPVHALGYDLAGAHDHGPERTASAGGAPHSERERPLHESGVGTGGARVWIGAIGVHGTASMWHRSGRCQEFYAGGVTDLPSSKPTPSKFDYDEVNRALIVEWHDGVVHHIPFSTLRLSCPCAVCSGELGSAGRFARDPDLHAGEDDLADIALVGAYGLSAVWADGHNTGIYTFERLRYLGEHHPVPNLH